MLEPGVDGFLVGDIVKYKTHSIVNGQTLVFFEILAFTTRRGTPVALSLPGSAISITIKGENLLIEEVPAVKVPVRDLMQTTEEEQKEYESLNLV